MVTDKIVHKIIYKTKDYKRIRKDYLYVDHERSIKDTYKCIDLTWDKTHWQIFDKDEIFEYFNVVKPMYVIGYRKFIGDKFKNDSEYIFINKYRGDEDKTKMETYYAFNLTYLKNNLGKLLSNDRETRQEVAKDLRKELRYVTVDTNSCVELPKDVEVSNEQYWYGYYITNINKVVSEIAKEQDVFPKNKVCRDKYKEIVKSYIEYAVSALFPEIVFESNSYINKFLHMCMKDDSFIKKYNSTKEGLNDIYSPNTIMLYLMREYDPKFKFIDFQNMNYNSTNADIVFNTLNVIKYDLRFDLEEFKKKYLLYNTLVIVDDDKWNTYVFGYEVPAPTFINKEENILSDDEMKTFLTRKF